MKTLSAVFALALLLLGSSASLLKAQQSSGTAISPILTTPDAVKWSALMPSVQIAVLSGDPSKPGPYTIRLKMSDGGRVAPHWHPEDENVTVLQGTFLAGMGDKFDASAMHEFPVGSYVLMPKQMHHFASARGENILQLHGNGPFVINYVNPADDPANATKK
jgi:hypothetical protein